MTIRTTLIASGLLVAGLISGAAQAALVDRGGGLIYDDVLNVTWLSDASYAKTSGYDADGQMTWSQAVTWAANLSYYDSVRNVTYTDWRLPTTGPVNGSTFNYDENYNGSTDSGYNVSEQGTAYAGSTGSEMAHLYYNSLDNKGPVTPSSVYPSYTSQSGYGLVNDPANPNDESLFTNLQSNAYWSGTEYAPDTYGAWLFSFNVGGQNGGLYKHYSLYALAVRPGDVAAVPEAETYALMLAGLGLIGWRARRRG